MKKNAIIMVCILFAVTVYSQSNPVISLFPEGSVLYGNISYNDNSHEKHLLDIYLPANAKEKVPVLFFIHGGGWLSNDKYADMNYMKETVKEVVENGFALVSIDYRFSTEALFPAQIQDCNKAISYIYDNADKYGIDNDKFAVMGFSAGGHLACMVGLSKNNNIDDFFSERTNRNFNINAVVDFYGPTELILFPGGNDEKSPEAILIGATTVERPDLAKFASPNTYVDKNDPPFLIIHGEKDNLVDVKHSQVLRSWLTINDIPNELIIVEGAPHFGPMFDADFIRAKVISFLKEHLH